MIKNERKNESMKKRKKKKKKAVIPVCHIVTATHTTHRAFIYVEKGKEKKRSSRDAVAA